VIESGCGIVVDPKDDDPAGEIVRQVREWAGRREEAEAVGERGRKAFSKTTSERGVAKCGKKWSGVPPSVRGRKLWADSGRNSH
jgi:hypothetical protein